MAGIGNTFEELKNTDNNKILPVLSVINIQQIQEVVPDTRRNVIETASRRARNINAAVDSLILLTRIISTQTMS